jgi:uncharacterized protein YbjT (DUF2867 family)
VIGLHKLEQKLNQIEGVNVLFLRAAYFMENTLPQAVVISKMGFSAGPVRPDLKLPMIASRDIGAFAADALVRLDFRGKQTQSCSARATSPTTKSLRLSARPSASLISIQATPDEQMRPALVQSGMSEQFANLLLEMSNS